MRSSFPENRAWPPPARGTADGPASDQREPGIDRIAIRPLERLDPHLGIDQHVVDLDGPDDHGFLRERRCHRDEQKSKLHQDTILHRYSRLRTLTEFPGRPRPCEN